MLVEKMAAGLSTVWGWIVKNGGAKGVPAAGSMLSVSVRVTTFMAMVVASASTVRPIICPSTGSAVGDV